MNIVNTSVKLMNQRLDINIDNIPIYKPTELTQNMKDWTYIKFILEWKGNGLNDDDNESKVIGSNSKEYLKTSLNWLKKIRALNYAQTLYIDMIRSMTKVKFIIYIFMNDQ